MDACERGASCFKVLLSKKNFDCFCVDAILNKREITEKAWSTWQPKMTPFWNIIKARLCRVTLSCFGKRIFVLLIISCNNASILINVTFSLFNNYYIIFSCEFSELK